ncbi:carbohydrate binding family 9 domain-containing protein, partial [bacterium]|nr:carbohydrate binding family 9 domain-containing protein [bacterium]
MHFNGSRAWMMLMLFPAFLLSGSEIPVKRRHVARRLPAGPPVVDGKLDDPCWQGSGWTGDFIQQQPDQGAEPSQETRFKILYDDRNLYVAIRAHDREPGKIERRISRRDDFSGDIVGICLDSYFDHRTGFEFNLTAAGVKVDLIPTGGGGTWDFNWDAVWEGKTAMEDSAWTAEYRIPFSQLRFPEKDEYVWGLHVWRWLHRYQEEDQFQMIPQDAVGTVHLFGELHGLQGISPPRRIELLPYVLAKARTCRREAGNPFRTGRDGSVYGGLDGKIGLSSNFNLDLTVYPDFGQVEADPSVINLTAFETFYEEKRPFFMEGRDLLDFGLGDDILFYSRRIGHEPSYTPETGEGAFVRMPESTDILAAAKLTGKTRGGLSIGILESVTAPERAEIEESGMRRREGVEPLTNHFVGRLQKEWRRGQTILGGMLTAVNRRMDDVHLRFLNRAAYSGGMDFRQYWDNKTYFMDVKALFSHVRGDPQALLGLQTASRHYFQRPDAGHLALDSSQTHLSGHGGRIQAGRAGNSRIRFDGELEWWSPGLELNDIGYLRSADRIQQEFSMAYVVQDPGRFYQNYEISTEYGNEWSFGRERLRSYAELFASMRFRNFWSLHGLLIREGSLLDTRMLRGGPAFRLPDRWTCHTDLTSDSRRRLVFNTAFFYTRSPDGKTASLESRVGASGRLSDRMELSVKP